MMLKPPRNRTNTGFVLPAAIFLLVVLGSLAAWLMNMTQMNMAQDALELEGERAYQAAQSGLEAGIYAATTGSCTPQNIGFTGFTASVTCDRTEVNEGDTTRTFFAITSVACNQPDADAETCPNTAPTLLEYSERRLAATVESSS
jgi:MSHA biogenesis protein MshP